MSTVSTRALKPIEWQNDSDAFSLIGDPAWSNYTVKVDVDLRQAGTAELLGRAGTQSRPQGNQNLYKFRVSDTGAWSIVKNYSSGTATTLASGTTAALGTGRWHTLGMTFQGSQITATADGGTVATVNDSTFLSGQVGIGVVGYQTDEFDNLTITPAAARRSRRPARSPRASPASAWTTTADPPSTAPRPRSGTATAAATSSGRSPATRWSTRPPAAAWTILASAPPTAPRSRSGTATAE